MGETEYKIFIVLATLILLVFINGIIIFMVQYRKRKIGHEKEKTMIATQHTQELLTAKLEIKEQTMQDIGREIHDNVGQRLTLASIYANQLAFDQHYPAITERINAISSIINESLDDLRSLSKNLTESQAEVSELKELIAGECERVNALNICTVSFTFHASPFSITTTTTNFILRILQEFLQNSLKHAACKNIVLSLDKKEEGLFITAKDDGKGFDLNENKKDKTSGIGLANMKKRAELIGAEFSIQSSTHKGTELHLFIPAEKLNA